MVCAYKQDAPNNEKIRYDKFLIPVVQAIKITTYYLDTIHTGLDGYSCIKLINYIRKNVKNTIILLFQYKLYNNYAWLF